jgi:imidazolonepropionase-like amidohydrolase
VPTLAAMRDTLTWAEQGTLTPVQCRKILGFGLKLGEAVQVAKAYGVPLALGTDYITRGQHGGNLEELELMHAAGLSLEETLLVATAGGAKLCGVADHLGRIAPGYVFDAVLLANEPGDLARLGDDVAAVFKAGRPVRASAELSERGLPAPAALAEAAV